MGASRPGIRKQPSKAGKASPTATLSGANKRGAKSDAAPAKRTASRSPPVGRSKPASTSSAAKRPTPKPRARVAAGDDAPRWAPLDAAPLTKARKAAAKKPKASDPIAPLRRLVMDGLERIKARDIAEIDIRNRSSFADLLVIASGTSTTHVKSIADEVVRHVKRAGIAPLGVEGQREAEWVLVDLGDIVVHVMLPRVREFYGLERLWAVGGEGFAEARASA